MRYTTATPTPWVFYSTVPAVLCTNHLYKQPTERIIGGLLYFMRFLG